MSSRAFHPLVFSSRFCGHGTFLVFQMIAFGSQPPQIVKKQQKSFYLPTKFVS